jgi:ABC-type multidrug transport system ATPase subunit
MTPVIELREICRTFSHRYILKGLSGAVPEGERLLILGENGSGKTTLLRIIATLLTPSSGSIHLWDKTVEEFKTELRPMIGVVFADHYFYSDLTLRENLELLAKLRHVDDARRKIELGLETWRLAPLQNSLVRTLSRGERQRLALLRSLLHEPDLLIWDEPTLGLDEASRRTLNETVGQLKKNITIVCTTHEPQHIQQWTSRTLNLKNGKLN